jgi:SnoaL-like domain
VATDYTSLFGGEPQSQAGDALIDGWRTHLATVVTQHLLGPIDAEIAGEQARARCHVRALHYAAAPPVAIWEVLGHYVLSLRRSDGTWKIESMTLNIPSDRQFRSCWRRCPPAEPFVVAVWRRQR